MALHVKNLLNEGPHLICFAIMQH